MRACRGRKEDVTQCGRPLCQALSGAEADDEPGRFWRLAAAGSFRRLHPNFGDEAAISGLVEALQGESGAAAYLAAKVLAAEGSSPAAAQIPGLRARIAQVLSEASQNERAQEMVYLLGEHNNIKEVGTRA